MSAAVNLAAGIVGGIFQSGDREMPDIVVVARLAGPFAADRQPAARANACTPATICDSERFAYPSIKPGGAEVGSA